MKFNRSIIFCLLQFCVIFIATSTLAQNKLEWNLQGRAFQNYNGKNCRIHTTCLLSDGSTMIFGTSGSDSTEFLIKKDTIRIHYRTFVARINEEGDLLFIRPLNKNTTDTTFFSINITSYSEHDNNDNVYLATSFTGNWQFDSLSNNSYNLSGYWGILEMNKNGDPIKDTLLISPNAAGTGIFSMFIGQNGKIYLTTGTLDGRYLVSFDSTLTNYSSRDLVLTNSFYTVGDRDSSGCFLAFGYSGSAIDIDPGIGTTILNSSQNNYVCLLDSSLNLISHLEILYTSMDLQSCFDSQGNIIVLGESMGSGPGNIVIDATHPNGIISNHSDFIVKFDRQFHANWIKYSDKTYINAGFSFYFGYPRLLKQKMTAGDGIILYVFGKANGGQNNFNVPMLEEPYIFPVIICPSQLIVLDSNGTVTTSIRLNNNGVFKSWKLVDDKYLYALSNLVDTTDISINGIPQLINVDNSESILTKYKIKLNENAIKGTIVADLNSNFTIDSTDARIPNQPVYLDSTNYLSLSAADGQFTIYCDTGTFNLKTPNYQNFNSPTPISIPVTIDSLHAEDFGNIFYFTPENYINDFSVKLFSNPMQPGMPTRLHLLVKNKGTLTSGSVLTMKYYQNLIQFDSSSASVSIQNNDSIVWYLPPIKPFENLFLSADFTLDTTATFTDTAYFSAYVHLNPAYLQDGFYNDNFDTCFSEVLTSYDPNNKTCDQQDFIPINTLDSNLFFTYQVNFQNTGNDTAYKIVVVDTLPENSDLRTFEWIGSSHNGIPIFVDGHILVVTFSDVILPDSNSSEVNSHGFIAYRIRPLLNLLPGDQMKNSADIFFDYNKPVKTNTTVSTFVIPQSINEINSGTNKPFVYPNPSHSTVRIIAPLNKKIIHFEFSDLQGRILLNRELRTMDDLILNVCNLNSGVYLLTVTYDDNLKATTKVIVE